MIFGMNGFVDIPVGLQYVCNSNPKGKYHLRSLSELSWNLKENTRPWLFFKTEGSNFLVLLIKCMNKWLQVSKYQLNLQSWFCMNRLSKLKLLYSCICIICKSVDIEVIYWCLRQIWWKNNISEACNLNCRNQRQQFHLQHHQIHSHLLNTGKLAVCPFGLS